VFLHQLGEGFVLTSEFVLEGGEGAVLGVGIGLAAFVGGGEGGWAVLEELLWPVGEEGDGDAVLVTGIGKRDFFQERGPEKGALRLRGKGTTLPTQERSSARVVPLTPAKAIAGSG
jgi:hypothetical protein